MILYLCPYRTHQIFGKSEYFEILATIFIFSTCNHGNQNLFYQFFIIYPHLPTNQISAESEHFEFSAAILEFHHLATMADGNGENFDPVMTTP